VPESEPPAGTVKLQGPSVRKALAFTVKVTGEAVVLEKVRVRMRLAAVIAD